MKKLNKINNRLGGMHKKANFENRFSMEMSNIDNIIDNTIFLNKEIDEIVKRMIINYQTELEEDSSMEFNTPDIDKTIKEFKYELFNLYVKAVEKNFNDLQYIITSAF